MFNHALKPLGGTHPKTLGSYHETNGRDAKDCSCLWSWPHRAQSLLSNSKKSNFNVLAESLIEQHLLGTDSSGAINDLSRSVLNIWFRHFGTIDWSRYASIVLAGNNSNLPQIPQILDL